MYITPDTIPAALSCRVIQIPDDPIIYAAVSGALQLLTFAENWEEVGSVTVPQIVSSMQTMYNDFLDSNCDNLMTLEIDEFAHIENTNVAGGGIAANTNTRIPFNNTITTQGGNVVVGGVSVFTIQPGAYLIDMRHFCGSGTALNRCWMEDNDSGQLQIQGETFAEGTGGRFYFFVSGYWVATTVRNIRFVARSTIALASVYYGTPYNQAGIAEHYGHVRFLRLGDPP